MTVIKNNPGSSSFLYTGDEYAQIASGPNSISTTRDQGNFINGAVAFTAPFTDLRFAGVFKFNPLLATLIPSTLATPMPTLTIDIPIKNISSMAAVAGMLKSLI